MQSGSTPTRTPQQREFARSAPSNGASILDSLDQSETLSDHPPVYASPQGIWHRSPWLIVASLLVLLIGGSITAVLLAQRHHSPSTPSAGALGTNAASAITVAAPDSIGQLAATTSTPDATISLNGTVNVHGGLILAPTTLGQLQPITGELYYDKTTNIMYYYNGTSFVSTTGTPGSPGPAGTIGARGGTGPQGPAGTSVNSIFNQTTTLQTADFLISGTGTAGILNGTGSLEVNGTDINQAGALSNVAYLNQANTFTQAAVFNGAATFRNTTGGTNAFQVQNASGSNILTVDTLHNAVVLGPDGTVAPLTVRAGAANGVNAPGANLTFDASNGTGTQTSGDIIFRTAPSIIGPITYDTSQEAQSAGPAPSLTFSHTVSSSVSDGLLIVGVMFYSPTATVSSVTYNGSALTKIDGQFSTNNEFLGAVRVELWYRTLSAPDIGTAHSVVVTLASGTALINAISSSYANVNPLTPIGTSAHDIHNLGNAGLTNGVTVATDPSQTVVDFIGQNNATLGAPGSGQTGRATFLSQLGSSTEPGASGATTMQWLTNSADWVDIAVPINPPSGNTPDALSDRLHIAADGNVGINTSSPQYTLDVIGSGRFQSVTNSTTAFQIQNSTGTALLTADTTNMRITVSNLVVNAALTVNGHLVTGGSAPSITAGSAACTTPILSLAGTDTAGLVTVTTGSSCSTSGALATITFASSYTAAPQVVLSAANAAASQLPVYTTTATDSFTLSTPNTPSNSTTYTFRYHTLQ